MKRVKWIGIVLLLVNSSFAQTYKLKLPSLIAESMVLQQNEKVILWGESKPKTKVSVKTSWGNASEVISENSGLWKVSINTPMAGGPYQIEFSTADTSIKIKDVYIGEVWLASGQSNMEMPLKGWLPNDPIDLSEEEIKSANIPLLRMYTAEKSVSDSACTYLNGSWKVCQEATVGSFSASAFFFAKNLYKELNVPIGIIHSSWGGTPAESWVSKEGLEPLSDFKNAINNLSKSKAESLKMEKWLTAVPYIDLVGKMDEDVWVKLNLKDEKAPLISLDDSKWNTMKLPIKWESTALGEYDGVIWFRKEIILEKDVIGKSKISLGPIDDMDATYINGQKIGAMEKEGLWQIDRVYEIPEGILKKGKNIISVRVIDNRGGGGIWGKPEQMFLELETNKKMFLSGDWRYLPIAEFRNSKLYLYGVENSIYTTRPNSSLFMTAYTPTALYNAMIAPITNYKIKGVIWYQGESNVGRAEQYEKLFPALIYDWRKKWGYEFPFYFVQIAPWNYKSNLSPALRDAQRLSLSLPATGMVVTLDIGNNENIHPSNKPEVGRRLALLALKNDYKKEITATGPLYSKHVISGNKITVYFENAEKGLILKENKEFELAGEDGVFHPANAKIINTEIELISDKVAKPTRVRYAWRDTSNAVLFNKEGLPASSFQIK